MGREIRRVDKNWSHPKGENGKYEPLYDYDFETKMDDWISQYTAWKNGTHPDQDDSNRSIPFHEWWGSPPYPDTCRPKFSNPTWYQAYETVSEGTPITPPFETKEELVNYLVNNGDFWGNKWSRYAAEKFVNAEFAFSMMMSSKGVSRPSEDEYWKSEVGQL